MIINDNQSFFCGFYSSCNFTTRVFIFWGAKAKSPSPFSRGEFSARQIPLTRALFFFEEKFCKPNNQHTMCEVDFSSNSPFWHFTPRHSFNELYSHEQTSKISCFFQWYSYPILSFYLSPIVIRYSIKLSA